MTSLASGAPVWSQGVPVAAHVPRRRVSAASAPLCGPPCPPPPLPLRFTIPVQHPEAKDFIEKCLVVNPDRRPSVKELLKHPWFQGLDLAAMERRELRAPFAPDRENFGMG